MGWFKKADLNDVVLAQCNPVIVNQTNVSIVIFLDRGVLYNKQVLLPGEAVGMTRKDTSGTVVPYKIHAVVGDESALPTRRQSMKNLVSTAAIPTAFIIGTMMAASSAGTMTGPASALTRATGGLVVRGMVIDSAALAAGSLTASRAAAIADKLIEQHPENYAAKSGHCLPGQRFVVVKGGIETPVTFEFIKENQFRQIPINGPVKIPMDTLQDKLDYYVPALFKSTKSDDGDATQAIEAEASSGDVLALERSAPNTAAITDAAAIPSAPPAESDSKPDYYMVTVPEGIKEGQKFQVNLGGQVMMVTCPPKIKPGMAIRVLPPPPQPVATVVAEPVESEEDKQLRLAIEESLKFQQEKERQDEAYNKKLKDDKRTRVKLF